MLRVVLGGRSPSSRPASATEGREADDAAAAAGDAVNYDPSWHIGEMRPRGYSAPASKHSSRWNNNGAQLRVPPEAPQASRTFPVIHAMRKVHTRCIYTVRHKTHQNFYNT